MRQKQFSLRVINPWNSLPDHVVSAPCVKSFEMRLDKFWASQDIRFDCEKLLKTTLSQALSLVTAHESDCDLDTDVA